MNILFLENRNTSGGISTYLINLITYLLKSNNVLIINTDGDFFLHRMDSLYIHKNFRVLEYQLLEKEIDNRFLRIIFDFKPHVVILNNPILFLIQRNIIKLIRKEFKSKIILVLHSGLLHWSLKRAVATLFWQFYIYLIDEVVFVSKYTEKWWLKFNFFLKYKGRKVLYNFLLLPESVENKNRETSVLNIGFVGRISKEKNPELFCEIALCDMTHNQYFVYGSGNETYLHNLKSMYDSKVNFMGDFKNAKDIYKNIDILIMTSPEENCPYAVLEAKYYGIPTIAAHVGGLPEIIRNGVDGILVEKLITAHFLDAIYEVAVNYDHFSEESRISSLKFIGDEAAEIYCNKLLN